MHNVAKILAENDGGVAKVLFGIIFVLIWFATSAMSALKKKKPPVRPPPRRPIPPLPARRNAPVMAKAKLASVQTPPIAAASTFVPSMVTHVRPGIAGPTLVRSTAKANALRDTLRPENLRQQFIFTEIIQRPLSLREDDNI